LKRTLYASYAMDNIYGLLPCRKKMKNKLCFCGAPFSWGPCSAEHDVHA